MPQVFRWTGGAVAVTLAVVAAALFSSGGGHAQGATVNVTLADFTITPDVESVVEGEVTFVVTNEGSMAHEMVVIRSDLAVDALPLTEDGNQVDEAQLDVAGEVEEFDPELTESATIPLTPGSYVLLCNIPGHYALGMVTTFTVTAAEPEPADVNVTLADFTITPDVESVVEGDVTFAVTNEGTMAHEMVIVRTDLAVDALPLTEDGNQVDEAQLDVVGEVEEFDPDLTETGTFTLTPGSYVLVCNIPGHYALGMVVAFTVTAAQEPAPELASVTIRAGGDFVAWVYDDAMASEVFGDLTIAWLWRDGGWVSYAPVLGIEDFPVTFASVLFLVGDGEVVLEVPALPAP